MTRYLGIDYGQKRIGLAVGDDLTRLASPIAVIDGPAELKAQVAEVLRVAEPYAIDAVVVGLPMNMNGTEGSQARHTRHFGAELTSASGKPVDYFDERLSSRAADALLQPIELTRGQRKRRHDAVAAQVILQAFLDQQKPRSAED